MQSEEEARRVEERCRLLANPDSEYFKRAFALVKKLSQEQAVKKERAAKRNKVTVESEMLVKDARYLEETFSCRLDVQRGFVAAVHPFLDGYAKCMGKHVTDAKHWPGEDVLFPGGELKQIVVRVAPWMHVCRMPATAADVVRVADDMEFVRRTMVSKNTAMSERAKDVSRQLAGEAPPVNVCSDGWNCHRGADTLVLSPHTVQFGAAQCAELLANHKAVRAKGWFFFSPLMLTEETGPLLGGRARFVVDILRGRVYILEKDVSTPFYVYDMVDMLSIIRHRSYTWKGAQYHVEMQGAMEDVLVWTITRSEEILADVEEVELPLWFPKEKFGDKLVLSYLTHVPGKVDMQRVSVRGDRHVVENTVARLVARPDHQITLANARAAVRDYSDQTVEAGGFFKLPANNSGLDSEFLARGCWRRAKYAKAQMVVDAAAQQDLLNLNDLAMKGSFVEGLVKVSCATGRSFYNAVALPVEDLFVDPKDESLDVSIVPEDPWMVVSCRWDPAVRGVSPLGRVRSMLSSSRGIGVIRQAWEWYTKTQGERLGTTVVERELARSELGDDRRKAVEAMDVGYDLSALTPRARVAEELVGPAPPELTPAVLRDDPYGGMQHEYDVNFPGVSTVDLDVRPWMMSVSDKSYTCDVPTMKMKVAEDFPRDGKFLVSALRAGCSGPRPASKVETMMAFGKRVGGAPDSQYPAVLHEEIGEWFDTVSRSWFKEGWQEEVKRRVAGGLGQPRLSAVEGVVGKMTPSNVNKVLAQRVSLADIIMTEFQAMVKKQPKDKLESSVAFEHSAAQTIMYQPDKAANALFSSVLGEMHDLLDDILRPGVMINTRRDKSYAQRVWNATASRRKSAAVRKFDVDISQCDKSQTARNILFFLLFWERLGLGDMKKLWDLVVGLKTAASVEASVKLQFLYQVVSGLFATISMNSLIVAAATTVSFKVVPEELVNLITSGDDVIIVLELSRPVSLQEVADDYVRRFNFEAKVFEPEVLYWCGRYIVEVDGYEFFVKDPEKVFSQLARPQPTSYDLDAAYESFVDDTAEYQWEELVEGAAKAVQRRHGRTVPPVATCRGIAAVRASKELFNSRFVGERVISV